MGRVLVSPRRSQTAVLLLGTLFLAQACTDTTEPESGEEPERPAPPLQVWIRHTGLVLKPGARFNTGATVYDENSTSLLHSFPGTLDSPWPDSLDVTWWSSNSVVRVSRSASLTAVAEGRATLWVDIEGNRDSGTVTVTAAPTSTRTYSSLGGSWWSTCAVDSEKQAWCWGYDWQGALGSGTARTFTSVATPGPVVGGLRFDSLALGGSTACGITEAGATYCWGRGDRAQIGNGTDGFTGPYLSGSALPVQVAGDPGFVAIAVGSFHGCGLTVGGKVYCWGSGVSGATGSETSAYENVTEPTHVVTDVEFTALVAGAAHTCALTTVGKAYCWGSNDGGQLGNDSLLEPCGGGLPCRLTPLPVNGDLTFSVISAGSQFSCGINADGTTYCWGANIDGQVGQQDEAIFTSPVPVTGAPPLTQLVSGGAHTCGLTASGEAYCWGSNRRGQLGDGERTYVPNPTPRPVAGNLRFAGVAAGLNHTCGLTDDGGIYCWGSNYQGQLGDGTAGGGYVQLVPARVVDR